MMLLLQELLKGIKHISKGKNILFMPIGYVHDDMKVLEKIFRSELKIHILLIRKEN